MLGILRGLRNARQAEHSGELQSLLPVVSVSTPIATQEPGWRDIIRTQEEFNNYFKRDDIDITTMHDCLKDLSLPLQKKISDGLLDNFGRGLVKKIIRLQRQDSELSWSMLSALMARHQLLESMGEWIYQHPTASIQDYFTQVSFQLPNMNVFTTSEPLKQLIQGIIFEQVDVLQNNYVSDSDSKYRDVRLVGYLKALPFPLNIKCLSEAMHCNKNTNWNCFLDKMLDTGPVMNYRLLASIQIYNAYVTCHVNINHAWNHKIAPEIRAIVLRPDLMEYAPQIWRLLLDTTLSKASREWAQEKNAKQIVLDFIAAIPDAARKAEIQAMRPMIEFLNMRAVTSYERISNVARSLVPWMPGNGQSSNNGIILSPLAAGEQVVQNPLGIGCSSSSNA